MYVLIILGSVNMEAEWPPFEKKLLTGLTICSLCVMSICNVISYFQVWFQGQYFGSDRTSSW